MTDARQIQEDLSFVRQAVARRERTYRAPAAISYIWAVYVLIGYTLLDVAPQWAGWFFMFGGFGGGLLCMVFGKRHDKQSGEVDRAMGRRAALHWGGGILLAFLATFALATAIPVLRGNNGAQVLVVMIGMVYFLAGVHFERHYLWLGPVLIAGGVLVGFFPHHGWTGLGAVIAAGLVIPTFFQSRTSRSPSSESKP